MRITMQAYNLRQTLLFQAAAVIGLCTLFASCSGTSSFNAAIVVAGEVVDEEGSPIEQIRLGVRENRVSLLPESFLSSSESVIELPDGQFRVACKSCSSMELFFSKDGYYSETIDFHVGKAEQPSNRVMSQRATNLERTDLTVVLRSTQNITRLVDYRSYLSSAAEGPVTVAPLRRGLGKHVKPERLTESLGTDARNLPGYIRMLASVTDQGALAVAVPGARVRRPRPPVVDFSEADGGVVLHRFATGNPGEIYRNMLTAPAEGYQSSMMLETTDRMGGAYYFYCRIGNLYGKGRVSVPTFGHANDGQEVVLAHIEIRLNLDGSRNVETAF